MVDKDGWAAFKVGGERWVTEPGAPEVETGGSGQKQVCARLDELVDVGRNN
jgi:hypothetical protein